jgi:hypothetical protein
MLAGVHPFSGASVTQMVAKMMTKEADPWPDPDLVPETLKQIVAKALKKEPLERYGSAGQMILDLVVARRELHAKPARSAITREVTAFSGAVQPASLADSTAPLRPRHPPAAPVTSELPLPKKGPLLLLLGASLVLLAGAAIFLAARGCGSLRTPSHSSAPSR